MNTKKAHLYACIALFFGLGISLKTNANTTNDLEQYKGMFVATTVEPGYTFRKLALKYYGNKEFWVYIYLVNKTEIPNPNKLHSGLKVIIPQAEGLGIDANDPASVQKAKELGDKVMAEFK